MIQWEDSILACCLAFSPGKTPFLSGVLAYKPGDSLITPLDQFDIKCYGPSLTRGDLQLYSYLSVRHQKQYDISTVVHSEL